MKTPPTARALLAFAPFLAAGCRPAAPPRAVTEPADEHARTVAALRPPKRSRPVVAVVGAPGGSETTDYLVPFAVLARSGVADVVALSTAEGPLSLMPALTIEAGETTAAFDARVPEGADFVFVPALRDPGSPDVVAWLRRQRDKGATIVGICAGVLTLSAAGLLASRAATTHWYYIDGLRRDNPTMRWVPDRRYVVDRGVVTTTGVTASMPVSLALVEAIAGAPRAAALAAELGVASWGAGHDSAAFRDGDGYVWTVVRNGAAFWTHETLGLPVGDGVDEVALAFAADAWSRTYRSRALSIAPRGQVKTRHGLTLVVDRSPAAFDADSRLGPPPADRPARALDDTLGAIERRYDRRTANWVARQLEYPR